jgi:DNA-directed RNA polymerase subunit RPC12/RpoP
MNNKRAYAPCSKCGAINHGASKHRPVKVEGGAFCGHCGSKLSLPGDAQVKPVTRWDKFPPANKRYVVRKFEREWVGNYRREQWVIVFESDSKEDAFNYYQAQAGGYYQVADESVSPFDVVSITCI